MKIYYQPERKGGHQVQGDEITKYGVAFKKGESNEIEDDALAKKLLTCPFFMESLEREGVEVITKKKLGRPKRGTN